MESGHHVLLPPKVSLDPFPKVGAAVFSSLLPQPALVGTESYPFHGSRLPTCCLNLFFTRGCACSFKKRHGTPRGLHGHDPACALPIPTAPSQTAPESACTMNRDERGHFAARHARGIRAGWGWSPHPACNLQAGTGRLPAPAWKDLCRLGGCRVTPEGNMEQGSRHEEDWPSLGCVCGGAWSWRRQTEEQAMHRRLFMTAYGHPPPSSPSHHFPFNSSGTWKD